MYKEIKNNNYYNAKKAEKTTTKFKANKIFFKENLEFKSNESNNKFESKSKDNKLEDNLKI